MDRLTDPENLLNPSQRRRLVRAGLLAGWILALLATARVAFGL